MKLATLRSPATRISHLRRRWSTRRSSYCDYCSENSADSAWRLRSESNPIHQLSIHMSLVPLQNLLSSLIEPMTQHL